jgi:hypothetical protein
MSSVEIEFTSMCCICLDIDSDDVLKYSTLSCCGNHMHKECYINWILHKGLEATCPMCRHSIDINKIPRSLFNKHLAKNDYLTSDQQRNLELIQSEYDRDSVNYFLLYLAVLIGIGILLCLLITFV